MAEAVRRTCRVLVLPDALSGASPLASRSQAVSLSAVAPGRRESKPLDEEGEPLHAIS